MHNEFKESADKYYYHVRDLVEERLEGQGSNDKKFLGVAAYNLANPLYIAVGRHLLVLEQRVADSNGYIVSRRVPQAAMPFVTLFGNSCYEEEELNRYVNQMHASTSYVDTLADLRERTKFQSRQLASSRKPYAAIGCTFAKLDSRTKEELDKKLEFQRRSMKGTEVVSADHKISDEKFAPYGYAAFIHTPRMFDSGISRSVRFYGGSPNDLVLEDEQPIDVNIQDTIKTTAPTDINDYSLVKFDESQGFTSQSGSVPYLGPLSLVNEIALIKDAKGYAPELIFQAIEKGLELR